MTVTSRHRDKWTKSNFGLGEFFPEGTSTALQALQFLKSLAFPNIALADRILLTIPVTVASGERSFSKLKTAYGQLPLEKLGGLSIGTKDASNQDLIAEFASRKSMKIDFKILYKQYNTDHDQ